MAKDERVVNVDNVDNKKKDPPAHGTDDTDIPFVRVNNAINAYITEEKKILDKGISTRVPLETYLLFEQMAARKRVRVSDLLRWLVEDSVRLDQQHREPPPNIPAIFIHTVPNLADPSRNARVLALNTIRRNLYEKLEKVRVWAKDRPSTFVKGKAEELIDDFNSFHLSAKGMRPELLEQDVRAVEELRDLIDKCKGARG